VSRRASAVEKLYQELKDKGLGVLGVDDQDTPEDVTKYWGGAHLTFPTILTGPRYERDPATGRQKYGTAMLADYASLQPYNVHECPTNILINADGQIVYRASRLERSRAARGNHQDRIK